NRAVYERTDSIRIDGRKTLAGTLPETGAGAGDPGPAPPDASRSGGEDQGRDVGAAASTDAPRADRAASPRPGVGDGAGEVHSPATRRIAARHQEEPPRNPNNYRITDADRLGEGGPKQKFRDNLAAIKLLRAIEREQRPATADEKSVLVRFAGWGGLPQVFDPYSREWRKERDQLAELLTDDELSAARATTLNAHYTSPTVIRAMY